MRTYYPTLAAFLAAVVLPVSLEAQSAKGTKLATAHPASLLQASSPSSAAQGARLHNPYSGPASELRGGGAANDLCANAQVLTVNGPGACPGAGVAGNNAGANNDGGAPPCDVTDTAFEDVWYSFNSGNYNSITIAVEMGTIEDLLVEVLAGGCGGNSIHCNYTNTSYTVAVTPGTNYAIRIASNNDFGSGGDFTICLTGNGGGSAPPNDACTGAVAQALAVGGSVTMSGNNTGATFDISAGGVDYTFVWESFTLTECATVTVNYCVPGSEFDNFMVNLTNSCPDILPGLIQAPGTTFDCVVTFPSVAAGTWLIPVLVDPATTPVGDYTIEVSAVACPPAEPYCTNLFGITNDIEPICRVQFAGIDNTSCSAVACGPALEDFTNLAPAEVTAGQSYDMTVTGNTAGNYANYITAFVDWDQDGTFEASYQIGTFTNTVCQLNATGQIAVPANALAGTARMRIVKDYAAAVAYPADPCGIYDFGQAEDYMVNVTNNGGGGPANDDCANAIAIGDGVHAFSSENATGTDITSCTSGDSNDIWFEYVATCDGQVTASTCSDADFDTALSVWSACGGTELSCNDDDANCDGNTSTVTFMATSGTSYWIRVAGYDGATGTGNLTVSCDGSVTSPENDDCGDVTAVDLAVDTSVNFTGTTTGASNVGDFEAGSALEGEAPTVWHAFTLAECANVTVSYCGTDPAFGDAWIFLSPSCPAGDDYILATNFNSTTCADGNFTLNYTGLAAGTYYLPVMFDAAVANGPYTIEVAAVACPPVEPYCTNVLNFTNNMEPICSVQFAGIDNTSCATLNCGPHFEDFTSLPAAQVLTGQSYTLNVTGNTDGNFSTFLTVFFDWDQDGTFETSQQVGSIVNSACETAVSTSVAIPETAAEGTTRMRIIKDWAAAANPVYPSDPCGTYDYGQAEDYLVNVTISIGVNETAGASWSVFPNPGNGDFTITSGNVSGKVQVEVLDMTGRLVSAEQHTMTSGGQTALNMAGRLAAGTYVLRLTSEAGRHEQRIVVR